MFVKASFGFGFSVVGPGNFAGVLGADKTGMVHSGYGAKALTGNNHRMVGSGQPPRADWSLG